MEQSRVCLAPLRFGAGLKGKLLDAMIMQTPSVTTSIGGEGMHLQQPWPGVVTDEITGFVTAAVNLYNNEHAWLNAQQNGVSLLNSRYDSRILGTQLITRINEVEQDLDQHRLNNFTGAMLKHHSMMSTKYMSQWIAAKNTKPI